MSTARLVTRAWVAAQNFARVPGHDAECNCTPCYWAWWLERRDGHA